MLSGTEATQHHQSLDDIVDTKSVTSYAVTVTDIHGKGVELPPPPKCADGERDFECPFCYIICPARYGRGRPWRTHLLQDLQPYICTYPDCEGSEQLFRSRREWHEHEASHRKAWRCPEHPAAVYRSRSGLEDHLRQQHLDSFPEDQLVTIAQVGETSTVEMRGRCPICFLSADAAGMGDFANHVANHLERFATFALPNSSEEDTEGASSVASRGRSGSAASQDVDDMSLPSDSSYEQRQGETAITELQRAEEESLIYGQNLQDMTVSHSLLSAESLLALPNASQNRLDALLASQADEENNDDADEEEDSATPADIEEHLERIESFRAYLLSLPGAQTVRFFRRYGSWRGHAIFDNGKQATKAVELFDKTLYPEVKIHQGTESNRNKLKFSVANTQEPVRRPFNRESKSNTFDIDNRSTSSTSIVYDDEEARHSKEAVLSVSDIPALHGLYRSRKLLQRDQSFAPNDSYNRIISFCYYDLTRLKVDAIVNSANNSMKISKHVATLNYSIHKAGGPELSKEAASKGGLKSGQAALTGGHNLPCEYVIHASRPQYSTKKGMGQFNILTECYRSALKVALVSGFRTVAFPCLGTGGCGFPPRVAARVALQEVREFLDANTKHCFERVVFVVQSVLDEEAYMDMFPVFFPPTHGDLEVARLSELSADRAALASQVLETRLQVQKVAEDLSAELSLFIPDFPKQVLEELYAIDATLTSIRGFLIGPKVLKRGLGDLRLFCSVMQPLCGSITELTESAKNMPFSGGRSHKGLWDDYNNHKKMVHDSDLEQFLRDCQDFAQCLDDILTRDGVELDEMTPMRLRLDRFKAQLKNQDVEGIRNHLDEVLYVREFQRETTTESRDIVRLHQIPSITQLYFSNQLEGKPTMVQPSAAFNHKVCLIREDITKLEVTVMVSSTDVSFAGMGTLDRKVFNKGGLELREECKKFGICEEGAVKLTSGYSLPAKHVLHVVPPEQYRKNSKDVLRRIYREILYTAQSLQATSIAIPSIGTGMLNYPRRDCASLAMEEVHRFLETAEPTNMLEKIIFVVYSSNDEFVYKSLLPVYFPPVNQSVKKALPASHPIVTSASPPPETISAPRRTLFSSIGDAVRNLGSSRIGKRPVAHTWRAINTYEEHALIGFESHAQDCSICKTMEQLYSDGKSLCEHGYPLAQTLLWYMNLGPDQLVYTRPVQIRQSVRLEVPEDMFPLSLVLLRLVEASLRQDQERPFVSPNRAYSTIVQGQSGQHKEVSGPTIYSAETAQAFVEVWSTSERAWSSVSPSECNVFIRPGRIDVYEAHAPFTAQDPLLTFILEPTAKVMKHEDRPGLVLHGASAAQFNNNGETMLLSRNLADSNALLAMLHRANPDLPATREDLETVPNLLPAKADRGTEDLAPSPGVSVERVEPNSEQNQTPNVGPSVTENSQTHPAGRLSPLQARIERLSNAASKFDVESPGQQSATINRLVDDAVISNQPQPAVKDQIRGDPSQNALTALERQIFDHLTEDLKSRPGSYIGQSTNNIASAINKPLEEVASAAASLAKQDYIHNTIDESTWVVSRPPEDLPVLVEHEIKTHPMLNNEETTLHPFWRPRGFWDGIEDSVSDAGDNVLPTGGDTSNISVRQEASTSTVSGTSKVDKADLLFQMNLLEQRVLSYCISLNSDSPSYKGCKPQDVANALNADVDEVELALDQLAEQGKMHLAPDGETWNIPLPRQYDYSDISTHVGKAPSSNTMATLDTTKSQNTPLSPIPSIINTEAQRPRIDIADTALPQDLDTDESSIHPQHLGIPQTRIDKAYVDPQVLVDANEEFHEDGYSLVVHRTLQRGELKQWVQKTLELRLKRTETARDRRGVSGHTWMDRGKDERDRHQANLDRVLAGDMREDELRHFAEDEEVEKKS